MLKCVLLSRVKSILLKLFCFFFEILIRGIILCVIIKTRCFSFIPRLHNFSPNTVVHRLFFSYREFVWKKNTLCVLFNCTKFYNKNCFSYILNVIFIFKCNVASNQVQVFILNKTLLQSVHFIIIIFVISIVPFIFATL